MKLYSPAIYKSFPKTLNLFLKKSLITIDKTTILKYHPPFFHLMKKLVIDTETTGLSPHHNKILTVGLLLIQTNQEQLKIIDQDHIFIKHKSGFINPSALRVNKINIWEHNKTAIPPQIACNTINSFIQKNNLQSTALLGHNFHFDKRFLSELFSQSNCVPKLHTEHEDTLVLWRKLQRQRKVPIHLRGNLATVANYFDIDYTKAHDALADCHITAQVYHKMLQI